MQAAESLTEDRPAPTTEQRKPHPYRWRSDFVAWAILVDIAAIVLANILAIGLESVWHWDQPRHMRPDLLGSTIFLGGMFLLVAFSFGLYRSMFRTAWVEQFHLAAKVGIYAGIPVVLIQFFLHFKGYDTSYFVFFFAILAVLFSLGRSLLIVVHRSLERRERAITRAIVLRGSGIEDPGLAALRKWSRDIGMHVGQRLDSFKPLEGDSHAYHSFWKATTPGKCDHVFISAPGGNRELIDDAVAWCRKNGLALNLLSQEIEPLLWSLGIRDVTGIPLVGLASPSLRKLNRWIKRLFDIIVSLIVLIVCLPLSAVVAVAILIEDGHPVIYRQRRALLPGKGEFWMYKFRSMRPGAESLQDELQKDNQTSPGLFFVKSDPRVTAVGRIIRRLSLDELPQFYNVLKGDMSIVGPRPLMLDDLARVSPHVFEGGLFALRKNVHPGLTGLWQISGRRELTVQKMLLLDLYYIDHQSIFFDFYIMARTFLVVLFGKGAY
jgi:exopolysaccharide biosynthesis polyprenyl glycosylphosphotransferase